MGNRTEKDMSEPREYTTEEVRKKVINHIWMMIDYWEHDSRAPTTRRKLSGLAHSICAMLDGCSGGIPAFVVAPIPHPSDKEFHKDEGENWFPENDTSNIKCDIGPIHEYLYQYGHKD